MNWNDTNKLIHIRCWHKHEHCNTSPWSFVLYYCYLCTWYFHILFNLTCSFHVLSYLITPHVFFVVHSSLAIRWNFTPLTMSLTPWLECFCPNAGAGTNITKGRGSCKGRRPVLRPHKYDMKTYRNSQCIVVKEFCTRCCYMSCRFSHCILL